MKATHIGAMLLASTGLLACGGGGEDQLDPESRALGEGGTDTVSSYAEWRAPGASMATDGAAGIAVYDNGGSQAVDGAAADSEGRAKKLNYNLTPNQLHHAVNVGNADPISPNVWLSVGMTNDAWLYPMHFFKQDTSGNFSYTFQPNAQAAVNECNRDKAACVAGTWRLIKILRDEQRSRLNTGICPDGTVGGALYDNYSATGRKLLQDSRKAQAIRFFAFSGASIGVYTGIEWYKNTTRVDRTNLGLGTADYLQFMVGSFLTMEAAKSLRQLSPDFRALSAEGHIVLQKNLLLAQRAAMASAARVAQSWAQSCPVSASRWWRAEEANPSPGIDIEMPQPQPNAP